MLAGEGEALDQTKEFLSRESTRHAADETCLPQIWDKLSEPSVGSNMPHFSRRSTIS